MEFLKRLHLGLIAAILIVLLFSVTAFADTETEIEPEAEQIETQIESETDATKEEEKEEKVFGAKAGEAEEPSSSEATTEAEETTTEPEETTTEPEPSEPETDPQPEGWVTEGEDTYYYVDGNRIMDQFKAIKDEETGVSYYYGFDEEGKLIRNNISSNKLNGYYRGFDEEGRMLKNSWLTVGEDTYYLDANHRAVTDTFKGIDGTYYGFDENGKLIRNAVSKDKINGYYRGFDKNGKMLKNSWLTVGNDKYYFDGNHRAVVNAVNKKIGNDYYCFDANGKMQKNCVKKSGNYYYGFGSDGKRVTGLQKFGNSLYYFNPSTGRAYMNGLKKLDGKLYNFGADGKMLTGKRKVGDYTYYFKKDTGEAYVNGVYNIDGVFYGFETNGHMLKGWQTINGSKYYFSKGNYKGLVNTVTKIGKYLYGFNESGKMVKGWFTLDGAHYYFVLKNGHGYRGVTRKINGVKYVFDSNGKEKTGWVKIGKTKYYYVPETGKRANGIVVVNGTPYSFKNGQITKTASSGVSGGKYYIRKADGTYVTGKGWTYYNGYKYYFESNGYSIRMDTESLIDDKIKEEYGFVIAINKTKCTITIYAYDTATKKYCIPVKSFVCSTGKRTPLGHFTLSNANRWVRLVGSTEGEYTYGQWGMRYNVEENADGTLSKRYLHSVYYDEENDPMALNVRAWNMLGKICSHGCIRMEVKNVRWIYKEIYKKAYKADVHIFESSNAGPFGKMSAVKLPSWHTWDPTDPNMRAECEKHNCVGRGIHPQY